MSELVLEFRVRWYQQQFHRALVERQYDRLMAIWHRRAGKDEICLQGAAELTEREKGSYWHCFPEYKQARKAVWNGVNPKTGKRRVFDAFPEKTIKRMQDDDMFIELQNGSTYQFLGSDRYDATVGAGPRGIIYSEWALSNPSAWAYHMPMIMETGGWAGFITTPRGNNHAKRMFDAAQKNPKWFAEILSIDDTGALTEELLAEALAEYKALHGEEMGQAFYDQEYLCSWAGAVIGSYFGAEMNKAEKQGRIREVPIDPKHPVHTAWDLGKAANNPIWCFQVINGRPRIVDIYIPESEDLTDWVAWLDGKGYTGNDYVPHDIMVTEWGTSRTRIDTLRQHGRKAIRVPRVSFADGLQAARHTINEAVFDAGRCELGIEALKTFRREYDDERKVYRDIPVKDWAEHVSSAFRYLGLAWRDIAPIKKPEAKQKELTYQVDKHGRATANMDVRAAVEAMARRKKKRD